MKAIIFDMDGVLVDSEILYRKGEEHYFSKIGMTYDPLVFRQRFMGFSQTWVVDGDAVLLVCWHQGPLHGQIDGASPS